MRYCRISLFLLVILASASVARAQGHEPIADNDQNQYVVSAKAGVVNIVEGAASVRRFKPFAMPEMLISGDELETGDIVSTGQNCRAEVLLNPGCYLRLGEHSEFVFLFDELSHENRIRLVRGSAIIEASAIDNSMVVEAPQGTFRIARIGLYRFNVAADGKADVVVRKGLVLIGRTDIKQGKRATVVDGGAPVIASFQKDEGDELDSWSKERARTLIAANKQLSKRGMKGNLAIGFVSNTWIFDPWCRCYTFLPYTGGFASPYGWGYSVCNPYWYRRSGPAFNYGGGSGGGYGGGTGGGGGNSSGGGGQPPPPSMTPPTISSPSQSAGSNQDAQPANSRGGRRP